MDIVTYAAAKAYTDKAMEQGGGGGGSNAFYAHYEDDKDNDALVCDKTFAEIQEAFEAGKAIFAVYDGDIYVLSHISNGSIQFINVWAKDDEIYGARIYHEEFEITYDEFDIDIPEPSEPDIFNAQITLSADKSGNLTGDCNYAFAEVLAAIGNNRLVKFRIYWEGQVDLVTTNYAVSPEGNSILVMSTLYGGTSFNHIACILNNDESVTVFSDAI